MASIASAASAASAAHAIRGGCRCIVCNDSLFVTSRTGNLLKFFQFAETCVFTRDFGAHLRCAPKCDLTDIEQAILATNELGQSMGKGSRDFATEVKCPACFASLDTLQEEGECKTFIILPCGHVYGLECMDQQLKIQQNNDCPTCRANMATSHPQKMAMRLSSVPITEPVHYSGGAGGKLPAIEEEAAGTKMHMPPMAMRRQSSTTPLLRLVTATASSDYMTDEQHANVVTDPQLQANMIQRQVPFNVNLRKYWNGTSPSNVVTCDDRQTPCTGSFCLSVTTYKPPPPGYNFNDLVVITIDYASSIPVVVSIVNYSDKHAVVNGLSLTHSGDKEGRQGNPEHPHLYHNCYIECSSPCLAKLLDRPFTESLDNVLSNLSKPGVRDALAQNALKVLPSVMEGLYEGAISVTLLAQIVYNPVQDNSRIPTLRELSTLSDGTLGPSPASAIMVTLSDGRKAIMASDWRNDNAPGTFWGVLVRYPANESEQTESATGGGESAKSDD